MQSTFKVSTDKQEKIQVESSISYALWLAGCVRAGAKASLEVRTFFVGEGASIEITGYTSKDKKICKISDTITRNRYVGALDIPEKTDPGTMIYFEAKLPKHGLTMESNLIPVKPVVLVKKMGWDRKEVRRNDEVKLTVHFDSGVENGDEASVAIYEYNPDNNHFPVVTIPTEITDNKIELTWKFDYHDDINTIPTEVEKQKYDRHYVQPQFFFVVVVDGVRIGVSQESGLMKFLDTVEFVLMDEHNSPYCNTKVKIRLADGSEKEVQSDEKGNFKIEDVPPGPHSNPEIIEDGKQN